MSPEPDGETDPSSALKLGPKRDGVEDLISASKTQVLEKHILNQTLPEHDKTLNWKTDAREGSASAFKPTAVE